MKITVDITDQLDDLLREDLEWHALWLLEEGNDKHEFIHKKAELYSALVKVIEYYSSRSQFEQFLEKTEGKRVE